MSSKFTKNSVKLQKEKSVNAIIYNDDVIPPNNIINQSSKVTVSSTGQKHGSHGQMPTVGTGLKGGSSFVQTQLQIQQNGTKLSSSFLLKRNFNQISTPSEVQQNTGEKVVKITINPFEG